MVTKAQKPAQQPDGGDEDQADATGTTEPTFSEVHDGEPVEEETAQQRAASEKARAAETASASAETLEEKRARLQRELAVVDEQARQQGGYREIPTHFGVLLCGDQVELVNTNATEHYCEKHEVNVPFTATFRIPDELREKLARR